MRPQVSPGSPVMSRLHSATLTRHLTPGVRSGNPRIPASAHSSSIGGYAPLPRNGCRTSYRLDTRIGAVENLESTAEKITELTKLDYYQYLDDAGDDLVVVDFFTDWCGPCKLIYPKLEEMSEELRERGVRFAKFNCNRFNKELGSGLGVRVAPTFFLYKRGEKVAEMTGAHVDRLRELIESNI